MKALSDITFGGVSAFAPSSGGGGNGLAVLDFGTAGSDITYLDITGQTGITANDYPIAQLFAKVSPDHTAEEHMITNILIRCGNVQPGVGFSIYAFCADPMGKAYGRWNVAWIWL